LKVPSQEKDPEKLGKTLFHKDITIFKSGAS